MSSSESEDCDIYTDLPATSADYEEERKVLKEKIKLLEKKLRVAEKEKLQLNGKYLQAQTNISSLYKTAVTEVNRKNRTIDDLRTQLENSVFHRSKRRRTDSPTRDKIKPEISRGSVTKQKPNKFCVSSDSPSGEGWEAESVKKLKLMVDHPDEPAQVGPPSHVESNAVSTIPQQLPGSKRLVQHHKAPVTLYSQRLLERMQANQRKDPHLNMANEQNSNTTTKSEHPSVDKKPLTELIERKPILELVDKKPILEPVEKKSILEQVDKKPVLELVERKPKLELIEKKPIPELFERQPTFEPVEIKLEGSLKAVHKTDKSQKNISEDDPDCMVVDIKDSSNTSQVVSSEILQRRMIPKLEPCVKIEHKNLTTSDASLPVLDFKRRRSAKVISISAGNQIIFGSPVSSISGRSDGASLPFSNEKSTLRSDAVALKRGDSNHNKFTKSSQINSSCSSEDVICLNSDGDESGDGQHKHTPKVLESFCAVEVHGVPCADMNIANVEKVNPLSVSHRTNKSSGLTLEHNQISKYNINVENFSGPQNITSVDKEDTLIKTEHPGTSETKCVNLGRRRRKPVSLGDSSFVVTDPSKK